MPVHTINFNARQESGLQSATAKENARRATLQPPPTPLTVTADQYLDAVAGIAAMGWERERRAEVTGYPPQVADQFLPGEEASAKALYDKYKGTA